MCGSFQSLVIVSDILSWCVLYGPWQCNVFYILTFSRSDAGNSTCPNKQKVRGKEGASVTLKCIYRLYNVHLRWYRLQPSQAPHFILVKGARSMSTEQNSRDRCFQSTTSRTSTELTIRVLISCFACEWYTVAVLPWVGHLSEISISHHTKQKYTLLRQSLRESTLN